MNQWLEQHRTLVLSLIGLFIVVSLGLVASRWQQPAPIVIEPPPPTATAGPMRVYVSGAVASPNVYSLPAGAIIQDALSAAGGPAGDADLNAVNLAASLRDGDQVYVPRVGEVPQVVPPSSSSSDEAGLTGPLNINTATPQQLELLPGIGPALAERIVAYREANGPFPNIEAIQNVSGIGPSIFDQIKDQITVN